MRQILAVYVWFLNIRRTIVEYHTLPSRPGRVLLLARRRWDSNTLLVQQVGNLLQCKVFAIVQAENSLHYGRFIVV